MIKKMVGDNKMLNNEEHYIFSEGIRIGFFQNKEDCQKAMEYCRNGFIISKNDYEKRREMVKPSVI